MAAAPRTVVHESVVRRAATNHRDRRRKPKMRRQVVHRGDEKDRPEENLALDIERMGADNKRLRNSMVMCVLLIEQQIKS